MINTENKAKIMTIDEICLYYPNEWVIIADTESDANFNVIRGQVLAHSPERDMIDRALMDYSQMPSLAIEYTGAISDDYAVML